MFTDAASDDEDQDTPDTFQISQLSVRSTTVENKPCNREVLGSTPTRYSTLFISSLLWALNPGPVQRRIYAYFPQKMDTWPYSLRQKSLIFQLPRISLVAYYCFVKLIFWSCSLSHCSAIHSARLDQPQEEWKNKIR